MFLYVSIDRELQTSLKQWPRTLTSFDLQKLIKRVLYVSFLYAVQVSRIRTAQKVHAEKNIQVSTNSLF